RGRRERQHRCGQTDDIQRTRQSMKCKHTSSPQGCSKCLSAQVARAGACLHQNSLGQVTYPWFFLGGLTISLFLIPSCHWSRCADLSVFEFFEKHHKSISG